MNVSTMTMAFSYGFVCSRCQKIYASNSSISMFSWCVSANRFAKLVMFTAEMAERICFTMDKGVSITCLGTESLAKPTLVSERPISRMMCA